jgi:hypothetical protein
MAAASRVARRLSYYHSAERRESGDGRLLRHESDFVALAVALDHPGR